MRDELSKIKWVPIKDVKPNPKNRNIHPKEQIDDIAKSIEEFGFRDYITVSNQSKVVVSGNGTLMAAKQLKLKEVPVMYQDFKSPEEEYTFGIAINELRKRSKTDKAGIHLDLPDFDPMKLKLDNLFMGEDFRFEPLDKPEPIKQLKMITCPECKHTFEKDQASSKVI